VTETDTLPAGLAFASGAGGGYTCTAAGQVVTCVRTDPLGAGDSVTVELTVDVLPAAYPQVVNLAHVATPSEETDTANNDADDPAPVTPTVVLELEKKAVNVTGEKVAYRLDLTNQGPSATVGLVTLRDPLPDGLRLISAQGTGWSCTERPKLAVCGYAEPIAAGATVSVRILAQVTADPGTWVKNVATASGGGSTRDVSGAETVQIPDAGTSPNDDGHHPGHGSGPAGILPNTGGPAFWVLLLGLLLLVGGGGLLVGTRRRSRPGVDDPTG
jgi:uncharacterized repeat protein (TIGR01451 family)/LPXTG-motif cell wall-anchored protein